jgi:SEC-C motif-containing protein
MEKVHAPTPEALMRSRYAAYVLKKADYLLYSWFPDTRPAELELGDDIKWVGLNILGSELSVDGLEGTVEFIAKYKIGGRAAKMTEKSHFVRHGNRWYYVDGDVAE